MALPAAVAALLQYRRSIVGIVALVTGLTLAIALVLSHSRSGLVAAAAATAVTILLLARPRRRLLIGAAMLATGALAGFVLYPWFAASRTHADFALQITLARDTDRSGWRRASTGLIPHGPSELVNAGPGTLRVTGTRPGEGVSVPVGAAPAGAPLHLAFQVPAATPAPMRFGLEDDLIGAGPASAGVLVPRIWRTYELTWRPSITPRAARAYFWLPGTGTFELRRPVTWTTDPRHPAQLSTRLLGPSDISQQLPGLEAGYVSSREGAARIAIDAFLAHPLIGIGWERFPAYAETRSGVGAIATHDEYLEFAAELGIPGLLAIALLALAVGWAAFGERTGRLGPALIGVLVAAGIELAFGNVLQVPSVILPAATAAAIAVALALRRRGERVISDF